MKQHSANNDMVHYFMSTFQSKPGTSIHQVLRRYYFVRNKKSLLIQRFGAFATVTIYESRKEPFTHNLVVFCLLFLFVKFSLFFGCGILILLVFRHQVIHVGLCLRELHLVHTFSSVPMKESLSPEHSCELF